MPLLEDLNATLFSINNTTNEIATDIDELIAKLPSEGDIPADQAAEFLEKLRGTSTALRTVADKWTSAAGPAPESPEV